MFDGEIPHDAIDGDADTVPPRDDEPDAGPLAFSLSVGLGGFMDTLSGAADLLEGKRPAKAKRKRTPKKGR